VRVLIACEFSSVVRSEFSALGHDAWSCDLLPAEGQHIQGDVLEVLGAGWDLMIAHPPCTYLAVSGARWWADRADEQADAAWFFMTLVRAPIEKIAVENPIGVMSTWYRKPDQIVQPWMFGTGETKATCLWLKGLPKLVPTDVVEGRKPRVHYESPGVKNGLTRQQRRSITDKNLAMAMAAQWGGEKEEAEQ
jgi:hypothetical protein